jgi:hypothetical protein
VIWQIMMCTTCMFNYYLCDFLYKLYIIKKLEKSDQMDDNVYILYIKIYAIRIYSGLVR